MLFQTFIAVTLLRVVSRFSNGFSSLNALMRVDLSLLFGYSEISAVVMIDVLC